MNIKYKIKLNFDMILNDFAMIELASRFILIHKFFLFTNKSKFITNNPWHSYIWIEL